MSNYEFTLYNEFQKEFAFQDYAGLTPEQAEQLRKERSAIAQDVLNTRKTNNIINKPKTWYNNLVPVKTAEYLGNGEWEKTKVVSANTSREIARGNLIKATNESAANVKNQVLTGATQNTPKQVTPPPITKVPNPVISNPVKPVKQPGFFRRNWKAGVMGAAGLGLGYMMSDGKD